MRTVKFLAAVVTIGLLAGCGVGIAGGDSGNDTGRAEGKSGPDGSRSFAVADFTGIDLAGSDNVVVTRGAKFSVVATGPQKILDKLEIRVEGGKLVVSRKSSMMSWNSDNVATIAVTLPRLDSAEVSGSGQMTVDTAEGDSVDLVLSGSGDLDVANVTTKALDIALAGSGDLTVKSGKADRGDVSLAGSGDIDIAGVTLATADIALAGSGDVTATATATADVSLVGSGDVRLGGGAKCDSSELGSGTVSCS
ncbi:MAG: DUF2807 domain-containing protein [Sphingopyxis sp.]|nr:DUF2807 domain-containing protein [Sphingopyxis sp.]